jgi:hypothetical protein
MQMKRKRVWRSGRLMIGMRLGVTTEVDRTLTLQRMIKMKMPMTS